jgi:hypothetical protein
MEIRCREASVGDEFPWCKTPGKDVIVDQGTIAGDVGFFLVFFAVAAAADIVELPLFMRIGLAALLIVAYYVRRTLHSGGALEEIPETLTLWLAETQTIGYFAATAADPTTSGDDLHELGSTLIHSVGGPVVLLVILVLNVYKPRGMTPYGWRKQQEEREGSRP